jgi:arylformamidase
VLSIYQEAQEEAMRLNNKNMKNPLLFGVFALVLALTSSCGIFAPRPMKSTDDVQIVSNLTYYRGEPKDAGAHTLDLFLPRKGNNWPTLVLVHGGAWVVGNKEYMGGLAYALAQNGYAVANINYRLTPRVRHPGHVEDVARAIAWVRKNAHRYGADPKTLYVAGHSAGAHLASLVSLNGRFLKAEGVDANKDIAGVVAISGVYAVDNHVLDPVFPPEKKVWQDASPIEHITRDSPPFLILFAEHEMQGKIPLVEQAGEFYEALQKAGVDSKITEIRNVNHDTIIRSVASRSSNTLESVLQFLKTHK